MGIRLKKDLHYFDKDSLFKELDDVNAWYDSCNGLHDIVTDYRIKSIQSVRLKYERYYPDHQMGKTYDDGYRGVHIYYQFSSYHYPIEIQYNTYYDRQLNNWLHKYVYKRHYSNEAGCFLRKEYEAGKIRTEKDFLEVLSYVLSDSKKI